MGSYRNANDALTNIVENLQQQMDEKDARATVLIGKNRMQTFNEYAFLFATNLNAIIQKYDLTKREIVVVLKLIEYMYFGNLLSFSNSKLAKDLKMDPSNLSKIIKRLKHTELIVEDEGNLYFNPHIACKGSLDEKMEQVNRLIDHSADILKSYDSPATISIGTQKTRKMMREAVKESESETTDEQQEG